MNSLTPDTLDLKNRLLLWHRVLAQMTGTMSLAYGGKGLSKKTLNEWAERIDVVRLDMLSIQGVETSRLDMQGREALRLAARTAPTHDTDEGKFHSKGTEPSKTTNKNPLKKPREKSRL